jgi:hypothetical protein
MRHVQRISPALALRLQIHSTLTRAGGRRCGDDMSPVWDATADGAAVRACAASASVARRSSRASIWLTAATCSLAASPASCGESPSRRPSNALCSHALASSGTSGKSRAAQARTSPRQPLPRLQRFSPQARQKPRKSCSRRREASIAAPVGAASSSMSHACAIVFVTLLMSFGQPFSFPAMPVSGFAALAPCEGGGAPRGASNSALRKHVDAICAPCLRVGRGARLAKRARLPALHHGDFCPQGRVSVPGKCAGDRAASSSQPARSGRRAGSRGLPSARVASPRARGRRSLPHFRMPPEAPLMDRVLGI